MNEARKPQLILALDVDTLENASGFVNELSPRVKIFKVGAQLFTAYGPQVIEMVRARGAEVFLDLKYFDIPHTVAQAVRAAVRNHVFMLTLHISGGEEMLKAAVQAAAEEAAGLKSRRALLAGVTVLTSKESSPGDVLALAKTGLNAGLDAVVCSAQEAAGLRRQINREFLIVTPGIRSSSCPRDDQKRTATVAEAVKAGSDFLVIGRPVLKAADRLAKVEEILGEIYGAGNK